MNTTLVLPRILVTKPWFETLARRHSTWVRAAGLFAGLTLLFACYMAVDDRTFNGVSVWTKPLKFSLSLVVYFATLAWFAPLMPSHYFDTSKGRWLTYLPVVCGVLEVAYIALQAARGQASHFNTTSAFYSLLYSLMGVGAMVLIAACAWMASVIMKRPHTRDAYVLAVVIGLWATVLLGGGFGGYMAAQPNHWVGGAATDAGGWWLMKWARDGGDLRVAHFFGMHAMQVLPVIGWAAERISSRRAAIASVIVAACVYGAFTAFTFFQAVAGKPFV